MRFNVSWVAYGFLLLLVCPIETIKPPHNINDTPITTTAQDRTVVYGAGEGDVNGLYGAGEAVGVVFGL